MINLRYHIVSITAVFLALGIGLALGGTFLDRYTIDLLEGNIERAESRIRATEAENKDLKSDVSAASARNQSLTQVGSRFLFSDRLTDVPVLVVTQPDVDKETRDQVLTALSRTGADLRGTLELQDAMAMETVSDDIAKAVDEDASDPAATRSAVNRALRFAFFEAGKPAEADEAGPSGEGETTTTTTAPDPNASTIPGSTPEESTTTTTTVVEEPTGPGGTQPQILTALIDAGYLTYTPAAGYDADNPLLETTGYRFVFIGAADPTPEANAMATQLLSTASSEAIPAVVVTAAPTPDSTTLVSAIVDDGDRADRYSTVDNVDTFNGLAATVIVLTEIDTLEPGHYGEGAGATALLPGAS